LRKLLLNSVVAIMLLLSTAPLKVQALATPCEYFQSTVVVNSPTSWWWSAKCLAYDFFAYVGMMTSPFLD